MTRKMAKMDDDDDDGKENEEVDDGSEETEKELGGEEDILEDELGLGCLADEGVRVRSD